MNYEKNMTEFIRGQRWVSDTEAKLRFLCRTRQNLFKFIII